MADAQLVLSPLVRVLDANGDPVPGAKIKFFEAGTTTPLTVYSDSDLTVALGTVVTCDDGGYPISGGSTKALIWTGTQDYKVVITDADDVVLITHDGIKGALVIPAADTSATPETPVIARTTTLVISTGYEDYRGRLINANPTGGSFGITLPSAVVAGDGYRIGIRHAGTANTVAIGTTAGQTIGGIGQSAVTMFTLVALGHCVWLVSDGAGWTIDTFVPPLRGRNLNYFLVTDRLAAPPVGPAGGARYILNGAPTGVWATLGFAEDDIVEYDGGGSWIKYAPENGYSAWIDDEEVLSIYASGAWSDQTGMPGAQSSNLQYAVYEHQLADGNSGGTATQDAWTNRTLNTEVSNTIEGVVLDTNEITLPVGQYIVLAQQTFHTSSSNDSTYEVQQRLAVGTAVVSAITMRGISAKIGGNPIGSGASGNNSYQTCDMFVIDVTTAGTITLQYWNKQVNTTGQSTWGLGLASAEPSGGVEVFARLTILSLASLQGARGQQGPQGASAPVQISGNAGGQVTAGGTVYVSQGIADAAYANAAGLISDDGDVTRMRLSVPTAPGAGESLTVTLQKNGVATALTGSIADAATTLSATGTVSFVAGDTWAIGVTASAGAAGSGNIAFGLSFTAV